MTQKTDFNVSPFFDDFDPAKKFHRILFRPRTVQTRELNQLQSILQHQIERLGQHVFKEGASVIGGDIGIAVMPNSLGVGLESGDLISIKGALGRGQLYALEQESGLRLKVSHIADQFATDPLTLIGDVVSGSNDGSAPVFLANNNLTLFESADGITQEIIGRAIIQKVGTATVANIKKGVYYIRGFMVENEEQSLIVSRFDDQISAKVGLNIDENIITSEQDISLLSNASGEPNYRAPGADRFKIDLTLVSKALDVEDDPNFIEVKRIEKGRLVDSNRTTTEYNELGHMLAKRSYETNGNYTVVPNNIEIREHLLENDNGGVYPLLDGGDINKFIALIQPGISYIHGYRVETMHPTYLEMDKARDTAILNNVATSMVYDGYFLISSNFSGCPTVGTGEVYNLYNNETHVGTGVVIAVTNGNNGTLKVYMRNLEFLNSYDASSVNNITIGDKPGTMFAGSLAQQGFIIEKQSGLVFPLPVSGVKSITDATYTAVASYDINLDGNGTGFVAAGANTQFTADTDRYVIAHSATADGGRMSGVTITLSGQVVGNSINVNAGTDFANTTIRVIAPVLKSSPTAKAKTLLTHSEQLVFNNRASMTLQKYDIVDIVSITDESNNDVKSMFTVNDGQNDSTYEKGSLIFKPGNTSGTFNVTYRYFEHGPGDYFSAESYATVPREIIKEYRSRSGQVFNLLECVDFRQKKENWNTDIVMVMPNSGLLADIEYYLNRIDAIYINKMGEVRVEKGTSAQQPTIPSIPSDGMRIFDIVIPAYTANIEDIGYRVYENKRFRMEDIAKLEKRIENVEYYTTLSQLETSVDNIQVLDPVSGLNRFKNGIFADPFIDFRLLDPDDADYSASIDVNDGGLRPQLIENGVDIEYQETNGFEKVNDFVKQVAASTAYSVIQPYATDWINVNPYEAFTWAGNLRLSPSRDFWWETKWLAPKIVNRTVDKRTTTKTGTFYGSWVTSFGGGWSWNRPNQNRQVITVTTTTSTTVNSTTSTVKTEVIPFMRGIAIRFSCTTMRPNTTVWPYFSNRNVLKHCQQDGRRKGEELRTDGNGNISGYFYVPTTQSEKFNTGKTTFVLADHPTNPNDTDTRTTFATAEFESGGQLVTKQETKVYTRTLGTSQRVSYEYRRVDPVAQSFTVDTEGGEFIRGVDLYFRTKSNTIPVTLEIREMLNGLPTHSVVTRKVLMPNEVNVSNDGLLQTYFRFDSPVYLENDKEYAIVVIANTTDYHLYYAQLGRKVIHTGYAVAKQPHTGVMFTSANGSTWTPHQNRDLKFRVVKELYTPGESEVFFKAKETPQIIPLGPNPFEAVQDSRRVKLYIPGHGLKLGDSIIIADALGGNGIPTEEVNKTHTIVNVSAKYVEFDVISAATKNGLFGGDNSTGIYRISFTQLFTNVEATVLDGCSLKWFYRYTQNSNRAKSAWLPFEPVTNTGTEFEGTYYNPQDFELKAVVTSTDHLTPYIDMHGFVTLMNSFIISPNDEECRGITQDILFGNPSTTAQIFVTNILPVGSTMKLYAQVYTNTDESGVEWVELQPTNPVINSTIPVEQQYVINADDDKPFIGMRLKIVLLGNRTNIPMVKDIRGLALA